MKNETSKSIINRVMKENSNNSKYKEIPNINDIGYYNIEKYEHDVKSGYLNTFKPLDKYLLYPMMNMLKPIFNFLEYKSKVVGFISLLSYVCAIYFAYYMMNNITWFFVFLGSFTTFLDKLFSSTHSKRPRNKKLEHVEMINILIKIVEHIGFFAVLKSSALKQVTTSAGYIYTIIFMSIVLIITTYHTSKHIKTTKNKIHDDKLNNIRNVGFIILFVCIAYVILTNTKFKFKKTKSLLDLFILHE